MSGDDDYLREITDQIEVSIALYTLNHFIFPKIMLEFLRFRIVSERTISKIAHAHVYASSLRIETLFSFVTLIVNAWNSFFVPVLFCAVLCWTHSALNQELLLLDRMNRALLTLT